MLTALVVGLLATAASGSATGSQPATRLVCSGSTVTSPADQSLVLTAGHCVHNGDNEPGSWATNWMFIPAYEDGGGFTSCDTTTYGCWTAKDLTTTATWYSKGAFADDAGFAVMALGERSWESNNL